jgi:hypothetical protein
MDRFAGGVHLRLRGASISLGLLHGAIIGPRGS